MAKKAKKCPFCGAVLKKENFNRHLSKVHGDLSEKEFRRKGLKRPTAVVSERGQKRKEIKKVEIKKRKKKRQASTIIAIVVVIVIISLVGVFMYQNLDSGNGTNGGTNGNGGNGGGNPVAIMSTSLGTIKIELYRDAAPVTAGNFISLANNGFYNGLIFHRVMPGFVAQGGGFYPDGEHKNASQIAWENTGHTNDQYTLAMARTGEANDPASSGTATSQFFINLADNTNLDRPASAYPYVVFGKVMEGFDVVDTIGNLSTDTNDWPDNPPVINSVVIQE